MATTEENSDSDSENDSDSDSENDSDSDDDEKEELMHELGKLDKKVRKTVIEMMKRVTIQHHEIKRLEKLLKKKDEELKSLNQVQKNNEDLKTQIDKLTNKLMQEQTLGMKLKCSNERLVDSLATLEVAYEVMVIVVKSYKQTNNTCS